MNPILSVDQAEEYTNIAVLTVIIFCCALLAVFIGSDPIIILTTVGLLSGVMIYAEQATPVHFFYTICFSASFLPYINLSIFPLAGIYIISFLFTLLFVIYFLSTRQKIQLPLPAKWMFLFLFVGLFSIVRAPDKRQVIVYVGQFFIYICIFIAAVNILEKKAQLVRAIKYVIYGSLIPFFASLVQLIVSFKSLNLVVDLFYQSLWGKLFMGSRGLERLSGVAKVLINRASNVGGETGDVLFRVFGTFVGPTGFGSYVLIVTVLAGALYFVQRKKKRIVFSSVSNLLLFSALLLMLILTWTRSAWLAFFIALSFVLAYKNEQKVKLISKKNIAVIFLMILIPILLFTVLLILNIPLATTVLLSITTLGGVGGSVIARLATMLFSVQYIFNHPLLGIGWGNYGYAAGLNMSTATTSFASAHNSFLELAVELGLPGLITFLIILIVFVKQTLTLMKAPANTFYHTLGIAFLAIWIGFMVKSMFGGSVIHPRTMTLLWALAGIQTAAFRMYQNEKKNEHTVYRIAVAD